MELWTGALSCWKCHWPDLKSAGLLRRNLFLNYLKTYLTPPTPFIIPHRLPAFLKSFMLLKNWCSIYARCSKSSLKHSIGFCGIFSKFKTILLHIVLLKCPHVQMAFFKFTSCDNQALVGCIPIAAVAVHLNQKSWKLASHLIRCIAIT